MSKVSTSKPVNPEQLDAALGGVGVTTRGASPLSSSPKEVEAPVAQSVLDAAVAAHVAVPTEANLAAILAALDASMASLATIAATAAPANGTLTAAVLSSHVRTLHAAVVQMATIQRRVLRVLRGDYSGTG